MDDLRILVVSHAHPHCSRGGGEIAAHQLFKELDDRSGVRALFLAAALPGDVGDAGSFRVLGKGNEILWKTRTLPFHLGNAQLKRAAAELRSILEGFRPDVVNFHHYFRIGVEALEEVKRYSEQVPVIVTLHEYLAICHRDGQMVKTDGRLCERAGPSDCATCFRDRSPGEFIARERYIRRYFDRADHFVSPSHFLIDRYVDWGIPRNKFTLIENGQPTSDGAFSGREEPYAREQSGRVRFAFFGQFTMYKGVDLLLEALAAVPEDVRRTLSVEIHGCDLSDDANPFVGRVKALLEPVKDQVALGGPYERAQLGRLMARNDWIVVPSIWWENSPLVIQEAFKYGRPVICSDIGGMAEKVRHLESGLHFRARSAVDLAKTMAFAATTPGLWDRLAENVPRPPTVAQSADDYLDLFRRLRSHDHAGQSSHVQELIEHTPSTRVPHLQVVKRRTGLGALFSGDFDQYARTNEDDEHALWFFLHIPKTAGSSFWHEIARAKRPASNIAIEYDPALSGEASRARALSGFLEERARAPIRSARGHFLYESLEPLRTTARGLRLLTMLRNPVDRVLSDFRYSRTPAHPPYREVILQYPSIEHYIHSPESQNKMVTFLRRDRDEAMPNLISRISDEFAFVGTTELYEISRLVLFRLLKSKPGRLEERRRTESVPENEVSITPELRSTIEKLNQLDMELYEYFATKWERQRSALEEWLGLVPNAAPVGA